jgi:hypothetical protein
MKQTAIDVLLVVSAATLIAATGVSIAASLFILLFVGL